MTPQRTTGEPEARDEGIHQIADVELVPEEDNDVSLADPPDGSQDDDDPTVKDPEVLAGEAPAGKLVPLDPIRRYLNEIRKYPPLDADEERELALRYRRDGDSEAAYRLITANLRLVVKIALMYNRVYANAMDLVQEGNIGLLEAIKRFDPFRGARLPTYAAWWIKAYIIKFIIDNFRIVRIGTTNERRKLLFNLRKEKEKLRLQGIEPTARLIADRLNVSEEDVREVEQNINSSDVSVDSPVDGNEGTIRYSDLLEATDELIDEKLARGELRELFNQKIAEFSETLSEREHVILHQRLLAEEPKTLQEIADQYGVTREAIRLNEKSLVDKIKDYMQEALKGVTRVEIGMLD